MARKNILGLLLLIVMGGLLPACAATALSQAPPPARRCLALGREFSVSLEGKSFTESHPLRVSLDPTPAIRKVMDHGDGNAALRLAVEVVHPGDEWLGFRVFLNLPAGAKAAEPRSPQYLGSVSFYCCRGEQKTFYLDMGETILRLKKARLWRAGAPITLTLFAIPLDEREAPKGKGIAVRKVTITALIDDSEKGL
jgi:hypothetical protein